MASTAFATLNRNQEWSSDEKKVLRKLFTAANSAASGGNSALISPTVLQTVCGQKLNSNDYMDIRALMKGLRESIDAGSAPAEGAVKWTTAFRMEATKKRVIRELADGALALIT